jgi:hypothetical protein
MATPDPMIVTILTRLEKIEQSVAENTELTRGIRDVLVASRVLTKVIKWVGAVAVAASGVYVLAYQVFHNGGLPPR